MGIRPLRGLGQHFLVDREIRDELLSAAQLTMEDKVIEVGPGLGFLTAALASMAGEVIAVEKDRSLAEHLKMKLSSYPNVKVIHGDILKFRFPTGLKLVSSPPYNISSKLIQFILQSKFRIAALLLQEDFAIRLTAAAGTRDYGRLTVMFQSRAQAELIRKVPRHAFYPAPKVDSMIVTITPSDWKVPLVDSILFDDLVRFLFTQRRRKVRRVLTKFLSDRSMSGSAPKLLDRLAEKRVFELNLEELASVSNSIAEESAVSR